MRRYGSSLFSMSSAVVLLATWLGVLGLEITHQWGHLLEGCRHPNHHGASAHFHAHCATSEGPHDGTQLDTRQQVCDLCEWQWMPVSEAPGKPNIDAHPEWRVALTMGEVATQRLTSPYEEAHSQRGPPARG